MNYESDEVRADRWWDRHLLDELVEAVAKFMDPTPTLEPYRVQERPCAN